ncbi:MAG: 16S rRNA (guanine(966)-N(2))-methyltransferase RsmD [Burkholderiaceae bacterium]
MVLRGPEGPAGGKDSGRVRIVGGAWKRTPLPVPVIAGLRPTPDRVRETLFNWLGQSLEGWHCLDAFAGSGALGLEAASRGAARVVMIERDRRAAAAIAASIARLGAGGCVELVTGDAFAELARRARAGERFDLVFIDPPFGAGLAGRALAAVVPLLAPGARVYVEDAAGVALPAGLTLLRSRQAGQVHYHLFGQQGA